MGKLNCVFLFANIFAADCVWYHGLVTGGILGFKFEVRLVEFLGWFTGGLFFPVDFERAPVPLSVTLVFEFLFPELSTPVAKVDEIRFGSVGEANKV